MSTQLQNLVMCGDCQGSGVNCSAGQHKRFEKLIATLAALKDQ